MASIDLDKAVGKVVVVISFLIAAVLAYVTRSMTCIPTDAQSLYLPAALKLRTLAYLSQLHETVEIPQAFFLHGKEIAILHFSLMQRFLNDFQGLWPLTLVCIVAFCVSAISLFFIVRSYWGQAVALAIYLLFVTSYWPYVYVLMVRHQALGFAYFLLSVFFVQKAGVRQQGWLSYGCSALCFGVSVFSSTVAIALLPLYIAAVCYSLYQRAGRKESPLSHMGIAAALVTGFLIPCLLVNLPDFFRNISAYAAYVRMSSEQNLFYYYQDVLREWIVQPAAARGGWVWVVRYLSLAMPVLFPVCVFCFGALAVDGLWSKRPSFGWLPAMGVALLAGSPVILAELKGVAQYGANYFPVFVGALFLTAYTFSYFRQKAAGGLARRWIGAGVALVLAVNAAINAYLFFSDVYPARMVEKRLSRELERTGIKELAIYHDNFMTGKVLQQLDPFLQKQLRVRPMNNIYAAKTRYILVPPSVAGSVYSAVQSPNADFDQDIYLNELLKKDGLQKYAVIALDTMATSRIWRQETEVTSYRDLILRQFSGEYLRKSRVWVLDAEKLNKDRDKNLPSREYIDLVANGVRNIGAVSSDYRFKGFYLHLDKPADLPSLEVRIYRMGHPEDHLVAYVYKVFRDILPGWRPASRDFSSDMIAGEMLTDDPRGALVSFRLKNPALAPGSYHFVIYRTGAPSDRDFYRIYVEEDERMKYVEAAGLQR